MLENRSRFIVALALLLVCGILATSIVSYFLVRDTISANITEQSLPLTSENVYSAVQRDLQRPVFIASMMANDTFVRDWVSQGEKNPDQMIHYLDHIQKEYQTITAFFVSEKNLQYYHSDGVLQKVTPEDPVSAWYFRVREMKAPYEINIDTDTADRRRITVFINYRVLDEQGNFLGAIGVGLGLDAFQQLIDSYQSRFNRQIYFVDKRGRVVIHGDNFKGVTNIYEHKDISGYIDLLLVEPNSYFTYEDDQGDKVYASSRLVPDFGWYLIVEDHGNVFNRDILKTFLMNILLALFITVIIFVLVYKLIKVYQANLEDMATKDKLTGASNRYVFDAILEQAIKAVRRSGEPLSLISIDLDRFKTVNDNLGHHVGDLVLASLAEVFKAQTRESDTLCRWGGDEFLLLMPGASLEQAKMRAEALQQAVYQHHMHFYGETVRLTISLGVAQWREGDTLEALLQRADKGMYGAKRAGRDQVGIL